MAPHEGTRRVSGAESGRKLLSTLLCFSVDRPTWTVAELAEELAISMSSTYRYVALLREMGLLDGATESSYRVTDRVVELARAVEAGQTSLVEVAGPVMTQARDLIDETVLVSQRRGDYAYCLDRVESRRPVRLQFDRGQAMPLHLGSMARLLLAAMPRRERARYRASVLPGMPAGRAALLTDAALDQIAAAGWAQSSEEVDEGIWGTAALIRSHGEPVATIGTAAPLFRLDPQRREKMTALMIESAEEISRALDAR
jgi:DNA-binding IclR family transcriptional regulator